MKILFSRVTPIVALILVQAAWFLLFFVKLTKYSVWISGGFTALSVVMFLAVLMSNQNPSYKMGWLVIIGILPMLGGLLYLLLGNNRPTRRFHNRILTAELALAKHKEVKPEVLDGVPVRAATLSEYVTKQAAFPPHANTRITYYPIGEEMYAAMLEEMRKAEQFIFFEYFIVAESTMWDGMAEILLEKAKAGVEVRVMYDEFGCLGLLPENLRKDLEAAGAKVMVFNPLIPFLSWAMNNRDHRKILVIDGQVGFNGGINIADEYINVTSPNGHWKDTGLKIEGDAVTNLTSMFLEIWNSKYPPLDNDAKFFPPVPTLPDAVGVVQPFSDSPFDNESVSENVYQDILWQATDYVYIFSPYLIITDEMQTSLCMAAKRGVDVRVVVPGVPDYAIVYQLTKSYYPALLEAGVKVYEYTPGYMHAKSYIADDRVAIVGTINMDYRSLYLHFECGTLMFDVPAIADLKRDYFETMEKSHLVTREEAKQGPLAALMAAVLRVVAPLM